MSREIQSSSNAQFGKIAFRIPTTPIPALQWIPDWMGLWLSIFPTVETLAIQGIAALRVVGSYFLARYQAVWLPKKHGEAPAQRPEAAPTTV